MLLSSLLFIPFLGIFLIYISTSGDAANFKASPTSDGFAVAESYLNEENYYKKIALLTTYFNWIISLILYLSFDLSSNQFQFVLEHYDMSFFDVYLGIDGLSIYFVLLTTTIMPIALVSNWNSISVNYKSFLIIMLLLETLLLAVFLVLDILLFYIFFESILIPLFLLLGLFGSVNKVRASYYLFLYTLWSSLFMLLSILTISSLAGGTDYDFISKLNMDFSIQSWLFIGMFIAIGVKTPLYGLNSWLLKAHVESPLAGSVLLAAIVLKLALYGIFRLLLPILPKACLSYTPYIYAICVITVIYAAFSTLRTADIKEIIAYSSVGHAAIYLMGAFSNTVQGIQGAILLGLGHGFVSSGLFITVGGVLYDRTGTRSISFYRGLVQHMPLFSILFFILTLANCGTPLTLNFVGEYLTMYGAFERLPVLGALSCSSIVLSAAYAIFLYNRVVFGGSFSLYFKEGVKDLTQREFFILLTLVSFTVLFGIYPSFVLDGLHYSVSCLIYSADESITQATGFLLLSTRQLVKFAPAKNKKWAPAKKQRFVRVTNQKFSTTSNKSVGRGNNNLPSIRETLAWLYDNNNNANSSESSNPNNSESSNPNNSESSNPNNSTPVNSNPDSPGSNPNAPSAQPVAAPAQPMAHPAQPMAEEVGDAGYESDSDRSRGRYMHDGGAIADEPVRNLPEEHLRGYIHEAGRINRHPELAGIERPEDEQCRRDWVNREGGLRGELRRRKDEGLIPDSVSPVSYQSSPYISSPEPEHSQNAASNVTGVAGAGTVPAGAGTVPAEGENSGGGLAPAEGRGTSSALDPAAGSADDTNASSSNNKRKFEEEGESSAQPASENKRFKQDSSDVTGETEPFDFGGGDD